MWMIKEMKVKTYQVKINNLTEDIIHDDCTSGGYYDAGDYVKFGFPLAFSLTLLSWGGLEFTAGYEDAGVMNDLEDAVR